MAGFLLICYTDFCFSFLIFGRTFLVTECKESSKCSIRRYCENKAQAVLLHEQIQEESHASKCPRLLKCNCYSGCDRYCHNLQFISFIDDFCLFHQMLQVIAEHLSVEEVEVIRDMFTLMDTDNDGKVTYEELKAGLRKVGSQLGEPEIKLLMEVVIISCHIINFHIIFQFLRILG